MEKMLKVGIISDLHLNHWKRDGLLIDVRQKLQNSIKQEKPDFIIDAGDCEQPGLLRSWLDPYECFGIQGNHDWYGKLWNNKVALNQFLDITKERKRIIGCTLWTDCCDGDPLTMSLVDRFLADSKAIYDFNSSKALKVHKRHKEKIEEAIHSGDIGLDKPVSMIVTHHCPSFNSVHDSYKKSFGTDEYLINYGFSSHLDDLVLRSKAKYWICGHTHWQHRYTIGETEVICNPLGYPYEGQLENYAPVYVEL
jgi:predicted phosphodiesterase